MQHEGYKVRISLLVISDLVAAILAFVAAWYMRFHLEIIPLKHAIPNFSYYLHLLGFISIIWPVVFYFHNLYSLPRPTYKIDEFIGIFSATTVATIVLSGIILWYRPKIITMGVEEYFSYSRAFIMLFFLSIIPLAFINRIITTKALKLLNNKTQKVAIIGTSKRARTLANKLLELQDKLGIELVGFIAEAPKFQKNRKLPLPVLGTIKDSKKIVKDLGIKEVYIALPPRHYEKLEQTLDMLAAECIVKELPNIFQIHTIFSATIEELDGMPIINLSTTPLYGWRSLVKRTLDIVVSLIALMIFSPIFLAIAIAIFLEDGFPIFYTQERTSLDGRSFKIIKFRTMRKDAEKITGPVWAVPNDKRRTKVGQLIRPLSLDELPQLFNVLKGEMSLVGPRPERPVFVEQFKYKYPTYAFRHRVKPGITGWAQVNGYRGNTSIKKRIEYDLYYIEHWSLGLDIKILWLTLKLLLKPQPNAY